MNIADLENPTIVPQKLVGLSGPGSKDESPSDVITTPVPHGIKDAPSDLAGGAMESVKSMASGAKTLLGEASPVGSDGLKVPFSGLNDPSKRRELERGASDVVTGGLAEKLANKVSPALAATAKDDASKAPGYRDAGGLAGGFLPNPLGYVAGEAIAGAGKGIQAVAKKLAPGAEDRIASRAINEMAKGAPKPVRDKMTKQDQGVVKEIAKSDPELIATPRDIDASGEAIQAALDKRTAELDRRYQSATDKYVSDSSGVPAHVVDDPTGQMSTPNFVPPRKQISGTVQGENPILSPNETALINTKSPVPTEIPEEPTVRIETKNKPRTEEIDSAPVIEMRPNGSLLPHEVKASIVSKANELARTSTPQSDAVHSILSDFEKEIAAETKATHDDPSLRWYRSQATKYQTIANKHVQGAAESNLQEAHREVANVIRTALEEHMKDPEINRLNAEVSALMKLKKINDAKAINAESPGQSPGQHGSRLHSIARGALDTASVMASLATHNPLPLAIPAVRHGAPIAASMADRLIARVASDKVAGRNPERAIAQALKSGISQAQIDKTLGNMPQSDNASEVTALSPKDEESYQKWRSGLPKRLQYEGDYDLRGFYKKNPNWSPDQPEAHMTDEFKLPNHPTFSDESKYFNEKTRHLAGHWNGNSYIPFDTKYKKRVDE